MAKIKFNGLVSDVHGSVGGVVVRRRRGKFTLCDKPDMSEVVPSDAQVDQRRIFSRAVAFARSAIANPELCTFYEPIADQRGITVYALAMGDYLNVPSIKPLNLSAYKGRVGDIIGIRAEDDLGFADLQVKIVSNDGTLIEQGKPVEIGVRSGEWIYTATAPVALGSDIFIELEGVDHAGSRAKHIESPRVGEDE